MTNFSALQNCPLFTGISGDDLSALLTCLSGKDKLLAKGETVLFEGDKPTAVGIVLSGGVYLTKLDYFGNRNIISEIGAGGLFGEAMVCAEAPAAQITVVSSKKSSVLFVDYNKIITTCPSACRFHTTLIKNMLRILAQKNMSLVDKIEHVTKRTIREKALSYLSEQAKQQKSNQFEIPFNRQELADFLSVERSALSAELSKLQNEGLIKFRKNKFELLKAP